MATSERPGLTTAPTAKAKAPSTPTVDLPVVKALALHGTHFTVTRGYQDYLRDNIFPGADARSSSLPKRHQGLLLENPCHQMLAVVWKESPFVSTSELMSIGARKSFGVDDMNCNSLAERMADDKYTLSAARQRITSYIKAAQFYGLVEERSIHRRRKALSGTALLHQLFVDLGSKLEAHPLAFSPPPPCSPVLNPSA